MKKHSLLALVFGAAVLMTACRKSDVQHEEASEATAWQYRTLNSWTAGKEDNSTVYSQQISDAGITADVLENGLVLAFKKSGNSVSALPFEEAVNEGSYLWYYQVSEGGLTILADVTGSASAPSSTDGIHYFIIPADKRKDLESKGYSSAELMKLSFDNARKILK